MQKETQYAVKSPTADKWLGRYDHTSGLEFVPISISYSWPLAEAKAFAVLHHGILTTSPTWNGKRYVWTEVA